MVKIDDIPQEILEYILYFVSPYDDLRSCRLVCHRWYLSCLGVVKKRKHLFSQSLKSGIIEWYNPSTSNESNSITCRYSHSASIYNSYMYVFGGCTSTNTTFNDLWKLHLDTCEWTRLLTTGTYPSPKAYASMVTCGSNLILFGGWTHPSVYPLHQQWVLFNELHIYNILANRWTRRYYENSPPPTAGHTATVHGNIVVIFGGLQKQEGLSQSTNDVYSLNLENESWFKPQISGSKPHPRYGHSQIRLDDTHLLVMAGCGGSNKLYSDVWLLTLPLDSSRLTSEWVWEPIKVEEPNNMPPMIWYNPACKVGDHIVIFSILKNGPENDGSKGNMPQLLVPGNVRRHSASVRVLPSNHMDQEPPPPPPPPIEHNRNKEVNINGQRGFFRSLSSDDNTDSFSMRARLKPSIRPNASSDRGKMMEVLSRMEKKIKTRRLNTNAVEIVSASKSKLPTKNKNALIPYLLNITKAVSCKKVTWLPVSISKEAFPLLGVSPQPCLLYTLLLGRGHLIMFGGIPNDPVQIQEGVSNNVHFISTPSLPLQGYVIKNL